jgi:hypothetical protein
MSVKMTWTRTLAAVMLTAPAIPLLYLILGTGLAAPPAPMELVRGALLITFVLAGWAVLRPLFVIYRAQERSSLTWAWLWPLWLGCLLFAVFETVLLLTFIFGGMGVLSVLMSPGTPLLQTAGALLGAELLAALLFWLSFLWFRWMYRRLKVDVVSR